MKKILSLLLSVSLLFGCIMTTSAWAAEIQLTDTDEALALLTYMDMIEGDEDLSANITRAEFASLVAKAIKATASSGKQYYVDADSYFWAFDEVTALTELGYLSVGADKTFRPNDNILLSEATKIVVSMIGYGELALAKGGFPGGYLQVADTLDIIQGISSQYITREQAYVMLMRAMNTPLFVASAISDGGVSYEVDKNATILSQYHDIYYIENIVNAAGAISLVDSAKISEGEAIIGSKKLSTDKISADMYDYLGMTIVGYYTEAQGKNASLVVALPLGEENSVITVSKNNVSTIRDDGGYYSFEYYDNERVRTVRVPRGAVVIKNGKSVTSDLYNELSISKGSYKFLDHNDDGKIDVLFVNEYYNLTVGLIENKEGMTYIKTETDQTMEYYRAPIGSRRVIYDKFDTSRNVDVTEESGKIIKFKYADGSLSSINDIVVSEVLSVYRSKDGKYIEVIKGKGNVKGTVDEISYPDNDTITVTIGGNEYDMDKAITDNILDKLELGFTGTFYLDAFGEIAFYASDKNASIIFGYLTEVDRKQSGLDNKTVYLRIFGQNGVFDTYTCYDKAVIDGSGIKGDLDKAYELLSPHAKQMIRFAANENKEVTFIDTLYKDVSKEGEISLTETLSFGGYVNSSTTGSFSPTLVMATAMPVLVVPNDDVIDSGNYDETCFIVKNKGNLGADSTHYVASYRLNPDGGFEDILLKKQDGAFSGQTGTRPMLISDVRLTMNDKGDTVYKVTAYTNGTIPVEYETVDDSVLKGYNLKKGDLVWFVMNLKDQITDVKEILVQRGNDGELTFKIQNSEGSRLPYYSKTGGRSTPNGMAELTDSNASSAFCVMYGYAAKMADGVIRFAYTKEDCANGNYVLARSLVNSTIIVYDREGSKDGNIYWTSYADIIDYEMGEDDCSTVVLHMNQNRVQAVFVYK